MQETIITGVDFSVNKMPENEYDSVKFINCNFSKSDLASISFVECFFDNCDFSLGKLNNTAFIDAKFKNCKLLGLDFARCKDFLLSFSFDNCTLDYASFFKKKIKKTLFKNCNVVDSNVLIFETDWTFNSNLNILGNCHISRSINV